MDCIPPEDCPTGSPEIRERSLSVAATVADAALGAAIKSGAFDGLPIFGTVFGILRASESIRDQLFRNSLVRFFESLSQTSATDRAAFIRRLDQDGQTERFGEQVLLLLQRTDDIDKPGIVGKVMGACIRGKIEYHDAIRLCLMIDRSFISDLKYLKDFVEGTGGKNKSNYESLYSCGFLSDAGFDGGYESIEPESVEVGGTIFVMNRFGRMLVEHVIS